MLLLLNTRTCHFFLPDLLHLLFSVSAPYLPTMAVTTASTVPLPKDSSQLDESSSIVGKWVSQTL